MERRWDRRREAKADVILYPQRGPIAVCRSLNVSAEGIFLAVDASALGLATSSIVELGFTLRDARLSVRHRVKGLVTHHDERGVGIMFATFEPAVGAALQTIVMGADDERAEAERRLSLGMSSRCIPGETIPAMPERHAPVGPRPAPTDPARARSIDRPSKDP